jgi:hypothetical protein
MDVKIDLLNRVIEEEAYVEQPQGFEVYHKETHECKWKKTSYGFKQLGTKLLMYNISVVKTSYDKGSVPKIVLQKSGLMDCKSMANSHDNIFEEVERL